MPARDPFYKSRAAEIAANIMLAELEIFRGSVFKRLDSNCVGEVYAETNAGTMLTLRWNVEHQCIETVDQIEAPSAVQEMQLCA